jgi:ATPase subunit of ABC transporter with duplicated ATPase domains
VASHDRYLVERVCDTVYALPGDGTLRHLPGGVEQYLAAMASAVEPAASAGPPAERAADTRLAKKELARLERQIAKLEAREATLHEQLALHATDYEKIAALDADLRAVQRERAALEDEWLTLADDA